MNKWLYTILNIIFFLPIIIVFWFGVYRRIFFKKLKFFLISGLLGVVYFFIVDLPAMAWRAWEFDYSKTLGVAFGKSVVEELVWVVLVFMTVAVIIEVLMERNK